LTGVSTSTLAIHGGTPVRTEPLPGPYPGALLISESEEREVVEVLRAGSLFRYYGPNVLGKAPAFEAALAARLGASHALALNSGTSALKCALAAVGVNRRDEVLVPAFSYLASADVVLSLGATPVFVEVDRSLTMDPEDMRRKITRRTRAITPVHLFGSCAHMAPILEAAEITNVPVVEDFAQSLGASYRGRAAGTLGRCGITSFQVNKVITAGEGGAVVTNDADLYERVVRQHDHGAFREGNMPAGDTVGEGMRITELQAAVLLAQLRRLDDILERLRSAKATIVRGLADIPSLELAPVPDASGDAGCGVIFFARDAARCHDIVAAIQAEGIRVVRQYGGKPVYANPAVARALGAAPQCPRTEDLAGRAVFLGLTTTFTPQDLADIVEAISKVMQVLG
jgi:8-amino-3,8-dideoxy-alpha-D-manno-octulosonate transaminase